MGKKLIIKGADFSENGIPGPIEYSLLFNIDVENAGKAITRVNNISRQFLLPSYALNAMAGKTIYGIKLKVGLSGNLGICKIKGMTTDPTQGDIIPNTVEITDIDSFVLGNTGVNELFFNEPVVLGQDEMLGIKFITTKAGGCHIYYGSGSTYPSKVSIDDGSTTYNSVSTPSSSYNWAIDFFVAREY